MRRGVSLPIFKYSEPLEYSSKDAFRCAQKDDERMAEYDMKLMDIDSDTLGIPDTEYDASVTMYSAEFSRIVRDLSQLGESVRIEVSKEGVRFMADGESANGSILMKHTDEARTKWENLGKEDEDGEGANDKDDDEEEEEEEDQGSDEEGSKKRKSRVKKEKAEKKKVKKERDEDGDEEMANADEGNEDGEFKAKSDDEGEEEMSDSEKPKKKKKAPAAVSIVSAFSPCLSHDGFDADNDVFSLPEWQTQEEVQEV